MLPPPPIFNIPRPPKPLLDLKDIIKASRKINIQCTNKLNDIFNIKKQSASFQHQKQEFNFQLTKDFLIVTALGVFFVILFLIISTIILQKYRNLLRESIKIQENLRNDHIYCECESNKTQITSSSKSSIDFSNSRSLSTILDNGDNFYFITEEHQVHKSQWEIDSNILEYKIPIYYESIDVKQSNEIVNQVQIVTL